MKKDILSVFILGLTLISLGSLVGAVDTGSVLITGNFEQSTVSISVPNTLELSTAVKGYETFNDFTTSNTGTTDLSITTSLESVIKDASYNPVFDNLFLQIGTPTSRGVASGYEFSIVKPTSITGQRSINIKAVFDLIEIEEETYSETEQVSLIFTAVPY